MLDEIQHLNRLFEASINSAKCNDDVENTRIAFLGKNGSVTNMLQQLRSVSGEQKKIIGKELNLLKAKIEKAISEKAAAIQQEAQLNAIMNAKCFDPSLPAAGTECGSLHPLAIVRREVEDIFVSMGFNVEDYSEIVDDYENFESLNIPKHHPARDMQDTFYLDNGQLLKTQTSAAQNAILRKYRSDLFDGKPIRAIFPGRCFRNEATDACHETTFFQMEGIMVDKNISISNLIYFMKSMLSTVFEREVLVRLRPGFFPFVEPGFELDINCLICGGDGCPACKHSGWLELCPCGMIHPNVLSEAGIDPDEYTGFAFGLGLTRLVMMRFGISDIRMLNSGNLNALAQFSV